MLNKCFFLTYQSAYNQHLDHGIRGGRTFFFDPKDEPKYLGDFAELRKGLYQSVALGHHADDRKKLLPLLNVDVSNKAFPQSFNRIIDLLLAMKAEYSPRDRRFVLDLNGQLSDYVAEKLHTHLSGLELCYCSDGTNKTIKRYVELGMVPAEEAIEIKRNDKKIGTTVQKYFDELKRRIQYRNLPCIRMGSKKDYIAVPMEYCAILGNQVSGL